MTTSDSAQTAVITGATSGLGYECARALLRDGWHVVMAVRDVQRGQATAARLRYRERTTVMRMDLASLTSVRAFLTEWGNAGLPPTHAVVCNAGLQVVSGTRHTEDGYELTFGVNHLGHFALVAGLLDRLAQPARIVVVSSGTHDPAKRTGMPAPRYETADRLAHPAELGELGEPGEPGVREESAGREESARPEESRRRGEPVATLGRRRYTTSKLCNVLFAYELDRRLRSTGTDITVNVFDPGLMPGSGLARDYTGPRRLAWRFVMPLLRVLPEVNSTRTSGARLAALVEDARFAGVSGQYFSGLRAVPSSAESFDRVKAADLWTTSERLIARHG